MRINSPTRTATGARMTVRLGLKGRSMCTGLWRKWERKSWWERSLAIQDRPNLPAARKPRPNGNIQYRSVAVRCTRLTTKKKKLKKIKTETHMTIKKMTELNWTGCSWGYLLLVTSLHGIESECSSQREIKTFKTWKNQKARLPWHGLLICIVEFKTEIPTI